MESHATTSYWKPSLSDSDRDHLGRLGLFASTVKGMPYRAHLKKPGENAAICGKAPGAGSNRGRMVNRVGWYVFANIEGAGRTLCEGCLTAAEKLINPPPEAK